MKKILSIVMLLLAAQLALAATTAIDGKKDIYYTEEQTCKASTLTGQIGSLYTYIDSNGDLNIYYEQSKSLNDNTYGANIINWSRDHKFGDLTGSDKARFVVKDSLGNVVLDFTVDYMTASSSFPSGYGCLGVSGGDGRMNIGSAANILAAKTSLDYNFNVLGCALTVNSPPADTNYNPSPSSTCPSWIYENTYEIKVSKAAFATNGLGTVEVAEVHNSPPKQGDKAAYPKCCIDTDSDGVCDTEDNCPTYYNPKLTTQWCKCNGINSITFKYIGTNYPSYTQIKVYKAKDDNKEGNLVTTKTIQPDGTITVLKTDFSDGKFPTDMALSIGPNSITSDQGWFHTSCSQYIGVGKNNFDEATVGPTFTITAIDYLPKTDCVTGEGTQPPCPELDFGDAPDPSYPTYLANDGARHIIVQGIKLGQSVDGDPDGQPDSTATGDDNDGNDDDDGIIISPIVKGQQAYVTATAGPAECILNAWIDFSQDGDWNDAGEQIITDFNLLPGLNPPINFMVPLTAGVGQTYTRFRCSTQPGLTPYGLAIDGEVEDYKVYIEEDTEPEYICGNGILEPGEECDDGNTNNNDACKNDCTKPICTGQDYFCLDVDSLATCSTICSEADGMGCFYDPQKCQTGYGYGCQCEDETGPGGQTIPEFSTINIILMVLIVIMGILAFKKYKG